MSNQKENLVRENLFKIAFMKELSKIKKLERQDSIPKETLIQERADALSGCEFDIPKTMGELRCMAKEQLIVELPEVEW